MKTVHKFPLELVDGPQRHYRIGREHNVVYVDVQHGLPTMWIEVDRECLASDPLVFYVFGTGFDIPDNCVHVGSCQESGFVWHIYKEG